MNEKAALVAVLFGASVNDPAKALEGSTLTDQTVDIGTSLDASQRATKGRCHRVKLHKRLAKRRFHQPRANQSNGRLRCHSDKRLRLSCKKVLFLVQETNEEDAASFLTKDIHPIQYCTNRSQTSLSEGLEGGTSSGDEEHPSVKSYLQYEYLYEQLHQQWLKWKWNRPYGRYHRSGSPQSTLKSWAFALTATDYLLNGDQSFLKKQRRQSILFPKSHYSSFDSLNTLSAAAESSPHVAQQSSSTTTALTQTMSLLEDNEDKFFVTVPTIQYPRLGTEVDVPLLVKEVKDGIAYSIASIVRELPEDAEKLKTLVQQLQQWIVRVWHVSSLKQFKRVVDHLVRGFPLPSEK